MNLLQNLRYASLRLFTSSSFHFPVTLHIPLNSSDVRKWMKSINVAGLDFKVNEHRRTVVHTDGCCLNHHQHKNPRTAGIGVNWGHNGHPLNVSSCLNDTRMTNNRSEILAVHMALLIAQELKLSRLLICTDSLYVVNAFDKWLVRWSATQWTKPSGEPVKNIDLWKPFLKDLFSVSGSVKLQHVSRTSELKLAHELANQGAQGMVALQT